MSDVPLDLQEYFNRLPRPADNDAVRLITIEEFMHIADNFRTEGYYYGRAEIRTSEPEYFQHY